MANLVAEKLLRTGTKGEKKVIRNSFSVYDRTTNKPKLLKKGIETPEEVNAWVADYTTKHIGSFLVVVREVTELEVVRIT